MIYLFTKGTTNFNPFQSLPSYKLLCQTIQAVAIIPGYIFSKIFKKRAAFFIPRYP